MRGWKQDESYDVGSLHTNLSPVRVEILVRMVFFQDLCHRMSMIVVSYQAKTPMAKPQPLKTWWDFLSYNLVYVEPLF